MYFIEFPCNHYYCYNRNVLKMSSKKCLYIHGKNRKIKNYIFMVFQDVIVNVVLLYQRQCCPMMFPDAF